MFERAEGPPATEEPQEEPQVDEGSPVISPTWLRPWHWGPPPWGSAARTPTHWPSAASPPSQTCALAAGVRGDDILINLVEMAQEGDEKEIAEEPEKGESKS